MFTVEHEYDTTVVTSLDQHDEFEDVEMHFTDDGSVFFRQWDESIDDHHLIAISSQQLLDLWAAMKQSEGLFKIEVRGG